MYWYRSGVLYESSTLPSCLAISILDLLPSRIYYANVYYNKLVTSFATSSRVGGETPHNLIDIHLSSNFAVLRDIGYV